MRAEAPGRPDVRAVLALVAVQLCFGSFPVLGKLAMREMEPFVIAAVRAAAGVFFLSLLARDRLRREAPLSAREHLELALLALLGIVGNQVLFISGLSRSTATNAALLSATIPVFTVALALLTGADVLSRRRLAGIPLALGGALVLMNVERFDLTGRTFRGDLMLVLNCLSYAGFLVAGRGILRRRNPLAVTAWLFRYGAVPILAIALPSLARVRPAEITPGGWGALAAIVALPTVAAYSLNTWALARTGPSTTAIFFYLQPVFAAALAAAVLGEHPGPRTALGALLIFAGVGLATAPPFPAISGRPTRPSG